MPDHIDKTLRDLEEEIAALQECHAALSKLRDRRRGAAAKPEAPPPAPETRVQKGPKKGVAHVRGGRDARPAPEPEAPAAGKLKWLWSSEQKAGYLEILKELNDNQTRSRESLLHKRPPQASKKLNAMERHGLITQTEGFVRITEAGEAFYLEHCAG